MAAQTVFGLNVRASEAQMHEIVAAVSADRIQASIETLVGFGTRHTLSETQSEVRASGLPVAGLKRSSTGFLMVVVVVLKYSRSREWCLVRTEFLILLKS